MAKKAKPKFDPFELAIRQMSLAQLKKIAALFKKNTSHCETADDYVKRLSFSMTHEERLTAMRDFILAGQTSMTIYALEVEDGTEEYDFKTEFDGTASREPEIVTVGKKDELIQGQQHVQWAVVKGLESFLDVHLALRVEPESMVVNTFFEASTKYLQIRANRLS